MRNWAVERDEQGTPIRMLWMGDRRDAPRLPRVRWTEPKPPDGRPLFDLVDETPDEEGR